MTGLFKKFSILCALSAFFCVLMPGSFGVFAQESDISGTWTGDATMPGTTEKDRVTLVLEKAGDSYKGKLTDSRGLAKDVALENVTFQNGNLRFGFKITLEGREITMRGAVNLILGRLIGALWPEGSTSTVLDLAPLKK